MIVRVPAFDDETACPFHVGHVYQRKLPGLQGRPSFRILAEPVRQQLGTVTHLQALHAGFQGGRALEGFRAAWIREHDRRWMQAHPATTMELRLRWQARHADRFCWVLGLDLIAPTLCMAEQRDILSGRTQHSDASGRSAQYVSSGGIDQYAEAVDPATLVRVKAAIATRTERRNARRRHLFGT